jgi:hypothetical protein
MKEFITNPKNRVVVIVASVIVIVGVVVALLFEFQVLPIGGSQSASSTASSATAPAGAPVVTNPGAESTTTAAPASAPAPKAAAPPPAAPPPAPAATTVASAKKALPASAKKKVEVASAVAESKDPFLPAYSPAALKPIPPPIQTIVPPFVRVAEELPPIPDTGTQVPGAPSPLPPDVILGRVSGIILSNGVHAIYEADGAATIVQPGDELPDGNGRVQSIQSDGITIRLTDNRIIQIPVTAGSGDTGMTGGGTGMPGYPGAGMPGYPGA